MFEFVIFSLTILGLFLSAGFAVTWIPAAIRARRKGVEQATWLRLVDYSALPLGIFFLYCLGTYNLFTIGVLPVVNIPQGIARLLQVVIFDSIVGLRAVRWFSELRRAPGAPAVADWKHETFSEHDEALEGTHD